MAALLAPGEPTPQMSPALWRVRACPDRAGELIADTMRAARNATGLRELDDVTFLTQYVHDRHIVDAAVEVAQADSASTEARIAALRALVWAKAPGHPIPLRTMASGPPCVPRSCFSTYTGHYYGPGPIAGDTMQWPVLGEQTADDYVQRIDSVAAALVDDATVPSDVRAAPRTVLRFPQDRQLAEMLHRRTRP